MFHTYNEFSKLAIGMIDHSGDLVISLCFQSCQSPIPMSQSENVANHTHWLLILQSPLSKVSKWMDRCSEKYLDCFPNGSNVTVKKWLAQFSGAPTKAKSLAQSSFFRVYHWRHSIYALMDKRSNFLPQSHSALIKRRRNVQSRGRRKQRPTSVTTWATANWK